MSERFETFIFKEGVSKLRHTSSVLHKILTTLTFSYIKREVKQYAIRIFSSPL